MPWLAALTLELTTPVMLGVGVIALGVFVSLVNAVFSLFDRFRPNPPLSKQFASLAALEAEKAERERNLAGIYSRLDRVDHRISSLRTEIDAGLKADFQRLYDKLDETNGKIQAVSSSFNHAIQDLERAVGVLEGRTSETRAKSRA